MRRTARQVLLALGIGCVLFGQSWLAIAQDGKRSCLRDVRATAGVQPALLPAFTADLSLHAKTSPRSVRLGIRFGPEGQPSDDMICPSDVPEPIQREVRTWVPQAKPQLGADATGTGVAPPGAEHVADVVLSFDMAQRSVTMNQAELGARAGGSPDKPDSPAYGIVCRHSPRPELSADLLKRLLAHMPSKVEAEIHFGADGTPKRVELVGTSGVRQVDEVIRRTVESYRCETGGRPVVVRQVFEFGGGLN